MDSFHKGVYKASEIYEFNANEIIALLTPHYKIIKWVEEQNKNGMTYIKFKNHIEFTRDTFLSLNTYVKNDGYTKLSKRCDKLLDQLNKHRNGGKVNPRIKSYFNKIFKDDLPTKVNILSIASYNLFIYFKDKHIDTDYNYYKGMVSDIFNTGKFNTSLKYDTIIISLPDKLNVTIASLPHKGKKETYKYLQ